MAEDDDISRRYRELPREEPPRHLDDAIRAAARRAVNTRPAPLVVPSGRQRWYFPLAAAAIIVLAVAVTLHVEREQPAEEIVTAPAAPAASPREMMREEVPVEKPKPAPQPERRRKTESAASRELRDVAPAPEPQKAPEPATPAPAAAAPAPSQDAVSSNARSASGAIMGSVEAFKPAPKPSAELRRADEAARDSSLLAKFAARSPEQWLQGIADMRKQGRHEEADKELAAFRKRYPDHKIPETMLERIERR